MLRIAITGAGSMGRAHARSIGTYGARVGAVHDVNAEAASALANECGAEAATTHLDELFTGEPDGLVVATPPASRIEPIRLACEHGVALMIEKPPALTMRDGLACQRLVRDAGVLAAVGLQLRYHPLYERLREMLAGQTIHLARTVCTVDYYLSFRMNPWFLQIEHSGGPLPEQAVHILDALRYVLGDPKPIRAHAFAVKNMAHDRAEFDSENAIQVSYELDNGVFGTHMNHCGTERFAFDLEVTGPHLRLQANITEGRIKGYLHGKDVDEPAPAQSSLGLDKTAAWLRAIETGDTSLVRSPFDDALQTLALIDAAVRSRNSGVFADVKGSDG